MTISVKCANGHKLRVKDEYAGRKVKCRECQETVQVPDPAGEPPDCPPPDRASSRPNVLQRRAAWKLPVLLGGGVVVLALAAVVGYLVMKSKRPTGPDGDREAVEAVARQLFEVGKKGDQEAVLAFFTEKARRGIQKAKADGLRLKLFAADPGSLVQIVRATTTGDIAEVVVVSVEGGKQSPPATLRFRREGGQWRFYAMTFRFDAADANSDVTSDFEELADAAPRPPPDLFPPPKADDGKPGSKEVATDALQSIALDQFRASWAADLDVTDQPAKGVLEGLAQKLNLPLETTELQDRVLARKITIQLEGRSRWELVEEVCRQVGLYPLYPDEFSSGPGSPTRRITFKQRPRPSPVGYAGPFRMQLEEVQEPAPNGTGMLKVRVSAQGLPSGVATLLDDHSQHFNVLEVVDAKGRNLHDDAIVLGRSYGWGMIRPERYERICQVYLKNLDPDARAIKTFRAVLRVPVPVRVEALRFDKPTVGATQKVGAIEVTLKDVKQAETTVRDKKQAHHRFTFEVKGISPGKVWFAGYDAQGNLLGTSEYWEWEFLPRNWSGNDKGGSAPYSVQGPLASVVAKVLAEVKEVEYELRLEDVPLRQPR